MQLFLNAKGNTHESYMQRFLFDLIGNETQWYNSCIISNVYSTYMVVYHFPETMDAVMGIFGTPKQTTAQVSIP